MLEIGMSRYVGRERKMGDMLCGTRSVSKGLQYHAS